MAVFSELENELEIVHLMYVSRAIDTFTETDLYELVEKANKSNRLLDIRGSLMYNDGVFLQVLEGEEEQVVSLFEKIKQDPRHDKVECIYLEFTDVRFFTRWFMGLANFGNSASKDLSKIKTIINSAGLDGKVNGVSVTTAVLKSFAQL